MRNLSHLFKQNTEWAEAIEKEHPGFFSKLVNQQNPKYLWIGCADSRVPANEIVGLMPGELFVHRNVANLVSHTDFNLLSVLQYAVDVLKVEHVMVVGHYGCGGVRAALEDRPLGLIDNWLRPIRELYLRHRGEVDAMPTLNEQVNKLCELNVQRQVMNVVHTTVVQEAWRRDQPLSVHGWVYALSDGVLRDMKLTVSSPQELEEMEKGFYL
jgi:carbonic anhydrase